MAKNLLISTNLQKTIIGFTALAFLFALLHTATLITESYNEQIKIDEEIKYSVASNPLPRDEGNSRNFTISSQPRTVNLPEASCFYNLLLLPISVFLLRKRKVSRLWISTGLFGFLFAHFWLWFWATQKSKENIESEAFILEHLSGLNAILMQSNIFAITLFALISILFVLQISFSINYAFRLRQNKSLFS